MFVLILKVFLKFITKIQTYEGTDKEYKRGRQPFSRCYYVVGIEGFHVTSLQQNLPSHAAHSGNVGSHKIWPNSLLLKLHKA